ncbi:hypothetical protein J5J10_17445 [Ciceribacter sp. L1K23]|uniref:hypothetical protein n=1 Tax=Ciceribacter sp. L1K23 TaxID=2820276 RepID=UPI001B82CE4F|nr:hypothetical protein [Ciceribacter sp. L1K23]MBR0557473.1 hypothetical protein [Ciceribacter sp. L1K23]
MIWAVTITIATTAADHPSDDFPIVVMGAGQILPCLDRDNPGPGKRAGIADAAFQQSGSRSRFVKVEDSTTAQPCEEVAANALLERFHYAPS